jgi:hypothetical protein
LASSPPQCEQVAARVVSSQRIARTRCACGNATTLLFLSCIFANIFADMGPSPNAGEHVSNVVPVRSGERFNFSFNDAEISHPLVSLVTIDRPRFYFSAGLNPMYIELTTPISRSRFVSNSTKLKFQITFQTKMIASTSVQATT